MSLETKLENLREGAEDLAEDLNECESKLEALHKGTEVLGKLIEIEERHRNKLADLLEAIQAQQEALTPKQEELFPEFE